MPYWVYILKSESTGHFYVGQTHDVEDRLRRHNAGRVLATRNRGPWQLGYCEAHPTRQAAVARERALKARKGRDHLEGLCAGPPGG